MWSLKSFSEYIDELSELALKNDPAISAIINEEVVRIRSSCIDGYLNESKQR